MAFYLDLEFRRFQKVYIFSPKHVEFVRLEAGVLYFEEAGFT